MSTIIIVAVFLLGWKIFTGDVDRQLKSRDLSKVDLAKIYRDKSNSLMSSYDVKRNIINGKYDRS